MLLYVLLLCGTLLLWRLLQKSLSSLQHVPGPPPTSFLTGNIGPLMHREGWGFHKHIAQKYGGVVKLHWLFRAPMLYVSDPLAMHTIVKDIETFEEPAWYMEQATISFSTGNRTLFGPGVLAVAGDMHRKQRKMLNPVFAAKQLRTLVPVFYRVVDKLVAAISLRIPQNEHAAIDVDILGWTSRAALELMGQGGIGYSFDPLTEDVPDAYTEAIKNIARLLTAPDTILLRQVLPYVKNLGPLWLRRWLLRRLPIHNLQRLIKISDILHQRSCEILEEKRAAIAAGEEVEGTDIMSVLLRANMAASQEDRLPEDQILAQMSCVSYLARNFPVMIFAGTDTSATAMARAFHLLWEHPEVQNKLRHEILEAKSDGNRLDYDGLHALPYMDAVCRETLRLHPPGIQTFRFTTKDAVLPLSQPIHGTDGTLLRELAVPRGTNISVAMMASNRSEALWGPDAHEWRPERWLGQLPAAVEDACLPGVYKNLMTFLGGPRSCMGFTFFQLEMKVVLYELIANFAFELSETPVVWNMSGISFPTPNKESTKPELWLRVRRFRKD